MTDFKMDSNNIDEFSDIRPYTDEEASAAFSKLADNPLVDKFSKTLFPEEKPGFMATALREIKSVDEFQSLIIKRGIEWIIDHTVKDFSYDGVENAKKIKGKFLSISNHRDIIVDPAISQYVFYTNGFGTSQLCVGDNLLSNPYVAILLRSNKMIKVIRGISARTLYLSSMLLSRYIRQTITGGESSVWIAQREGRTKDGMDSTEQGLLKMLDMSGGKDFVSNFLELNMLPLSISYEYEPCDIFKAREVLISRTQKYVKKDNEDVESIIYGLRQWKGNVHLNIGATLTEEEVYNASKCVKNDRYLFIRHAIDKRIIEGYHLWKTNYMGYDLANGTDKYSSFYTPGELREFKSYIESRLDKVEEELDRLQLRDILLRIYGNPVLAKEKLNTASGRQ